MAIQNVMRRRLFMNAEMMFQIQFCCPFFYKYVVKKKP